MEGGREDEGGRRGGRAIQGHCSKESAKELTSKLALLRSARSKTQFVRSQLDKLHLQRLAHLKLMFLRSRLERSTPSKSIP